MTVTSCPCARAASSTRKGNLPLPAIRPRRMGAQQAKGTDDDDTSLFIDDHLFRAPTRFAQDDTAPRAADEVDEVLNLGVRQCWIVLDRRQCACRMKLRHEKIP